MTDTCFNDLRLNATVHIGHAGYFACNKTVQVGRPSSKEELLALIKSFPRVKGVGVGHSWSRDFFCAGSDADSIDIVLTELTSTRRM